MPFKIKKIYPYLLKDVLIFAVRIQQPFQCKSLFHNFEIANKCHRFKKNVLLEVVGTHPSHHFDERLFVDVVTDAVADQLVNLRFVQIRRVPVIDFMKLRFRRKSFVANLNSVIVEKICIIQKLQT
jgi:hypothetical protein